MKIFAVNLTVDTKTTDLYDQVAINKYPIIVICENESELIEKLSSEDTAKWIRSNIRTQRLFDSAYYHIRQINDYNVTDICWKVNSIINILY